MPQKDFLYFRKLKDQLVKKVQEKHPEINPDISLWKGKEITIFQQDLEECVNGRISEKWFYTHLKSETEKLPRIDILDLLSSYVGFDDWLAFKNENKFEKNKFNKVVWLVLVSVSVIGFLYFIVFRTGVYTISVIDAYTNKPIDPEKVILTQFFNDQSPKIIEVNEEGEYIISPENSELSLAVNAPYYHPDTIYRKVKRFGNNREILRLFPNDYALILHYFSNSDTEDWTQRRLQLSEIISENAKIFQLDSDRQLALEMYSKDAFINKLTIPSKSLRNIDIVDIQFKGEQISLLKFIQQKGGIDE